MSTQNPYQPPGAKPAESVRIAKSFTYDNAPESKGVIFHGAIFASEDGLFISHDKHTRQSAVTAAAAFGLIGMAINHLMTRNKKFDYPFPALPVDELPDSIRVRMAEHSFKDKSVVSVIPRNEVQSYSSSMIKGKKFQIGEITLNLTAPVNKGLKRLPEMGYEVL